MSGTERIVNERLRQRDVEGFNNEHDDGHLDGALAVAAGAYALYGFCDLAPIVWPWAEHWWKPVPATMDDLTLSAGTREARCRQLAKAGALLAAEIDRLERVTEREHRE